MSDNLLLTVLGAVGVGALLLGMKEKENIKENWGPQGMLGLSVRKERVKVNKKNPNDKSAINFAKPPAELKQNLAQIQKMARAGVTDSTQQLSTLKTQAMARASGQSQLARSVLPHVGDVGSVEGFVSPSSLGSGMVTSNDYVSYPQFNQSTPLQSPSMNLPSQIRYNPPSLNNMGITSAYQSDANHLYNGMDYANLVRENYEDTQGYRQDIKTGVPNPEAMKDGRNSVLGSIANPDSYLASLKQGNKAYSGNRDSAPVNSLPLSSMDSSLGDDQEAENTMIYDRYIYANGRNGGWRASSSGSSDLIRGDLAVNVDPCQKGWFQSSLTPADLRRGALSVIAGPNGNSNNTAAELANQYGAVTTLNQGQNDVPTVLQKMLSTTGVGGNISTVSSFA
jgi:hypothetical protein